MDNRALTFALLKRREDIREFLGTEVYAQHADLAAETITAAMVWGGSTNPLEVGFDLSESARKAGHELASEMFLCGALDLIERATRPPE